MFGSKSISTISLLEKQIQTLEFALMKATIADYDLYTRVLTELGHLYNSKMNIIKVMDQEAFSAKIYYSSIDPEKEQLSKTA